MQIKHLAVACLTLLMPFATLQAQTLEEVLKSHYEATGADLMAKKNSVTTTGSLNQGGLDIPFTQISMRPLYFRVEGTFQGLTFIQTYNGTEGWTLNPFGMSTAPEPMAEDVLKQMKSSADMDGKLYDWQAKGNKVELLGSEDVEGTPCFKIKVVTTDSTEYTEYLDKETYMMIKSASKTMMMGVEVLSETYMSNYMLVDGIAFPGRIENRYNGTTGEVITISKVEYDIAYDAALFGKPGGN